MKKLNRFSVLVGFLTGAGVLSYIPSVMAQEAEPGPASEIMESIDISMQPGPMPDGPPGMMPGPGGMPGMPGMGGPMPGMMPDPEDMIAMHPGGDLMMIRAGVHSQFSDDQLEKMYKIKSDFMDKAGLKMVELKSHERALHDMITEPEFDRGKAQSIQNKINGLHDELANLRLDQQMGLLNCLTPDQRKELRRSYVKHMDFGMMGGMHGMHGMRMMHHGPHGGPGGHGGGGGEHHEHHGPPPPGPDSDKG